MARVAGVHGGEYLVLELVVDVIPLEELLLGGARPADEETLQVGDLQVDLGDVLPDPGVVLVEVHVPEPLVPPGALTPRPGLPLDARGDVLDDVGPLPLEHGECGGLGVDDDDAVAVLGAEELEEGIQDEPVLAPVVVDADGIRWDDGVGLHIPDAVLLAGYGAREEDEARGGDGLEELELLHDLGEAVLDVLLGGLGLYVPGGAPLGAEVAHHLAQLLPRGDVDGDEFSAPPLLGLQHL